MMFKTFASRAIIPMATAIAGFLVVSSVVLYSFVRKELVDTAVHYERRLAETVVNATRFSMMRDDRENLEQIVRNIGGEEGLDHLRIFNKAGVIAFSSLEGEVDTKVDKSAPGCVQCHRGGEPLTQLGSMEQARSYEGADGKGVLALTVPIYNHPDCYQSSCHVHDASQEVLGILSIGQSRETLERVQSRVRWQMVIFVLMAVVLSISGAGALLWRNLFLPIRQAVEYCRYNAKGGEKPPHIQHTPEIDALCRLIKEMVLPPAESHKPPTEPGDR